MLFNFFSVVEPMLHFCNCHGTLITKILIRTALAVVFPNKILSLGVLKLEQARGNLGAIAQVYRTGTLMTFDHSPWNIRFHFLLSPSRLFSEINFMNAINWLFFFTESYIYSDVSMLLLFLNFKTFFSNQLYEIEFRSCYIPL